MNSRYIGLGVKTDCRNFLKRFIATESVRFKEFVKIWQDMKFSCIYCGQESFAELYEFIEEVLKIAKEFFLPPHPLQTRLCGLYLLYGLYYKQPTIEDGEYLVKIRLNFKEWQDSYSLMKFVCEEQHYDALFIFNKLLAENAFHFCAMPREYGLEKSMRKYLERNDTADENLSHKSELLTLEESGILNSLDEISKKYYELKCKLNNESKENKPHQLLDYASPMIADDIRKKLASAMDDSSDQKDEEQDTKISIGAHRKKLKEKACFGAGPSRST